MPGCLSADGRLFNIFGPDVEKLMSPNRLFGRGTTKVLVSAAAVCGLWRYTSVICLYAFMPLSNSKDNKTKPKSAGKDYAVSRLSDAH